MRVSRKHGAWVLLVSGALLACSASSTRPAELGDCVPIGDASCSLPVNNSSGGGPMDGGSSSDGGVSSDGATSCGAAGSLVSTQNTTCLPCIVGSCCGSDQACSGLPACLTLVQCMQACQSTDQSCISSCANSSPTGQSAYNDFSQCLGVQCPGCPGLPEQGIADL